MLACEDKELNQWASLRKAVQIRFVHHALEYLWDKIIFFFYV